MLEFSPSQTRQGFDKKRFDENFDRVFGKREDNLNNTTESDRSSIPRIDRLVRERVLQEPQDPANVYRGEHSITLGGQRIPKRAEDSFFTKENWSD